MAGGQERILRRRISTVQSTKKITRAMELIAASRIVRAQARVRAAVPYSETITEVVHDLADAGAGSDSPLLGYNAYVLRAAEGSMREHARLGRDYGLVLVGRKAESYFRFRHYRIDASFTGFSEQPTYEDARRIGGVLEKPFLAGEYDLVELIYTRFVSAGSQEVVVRPLMPLEREVLAAGDGDTPDEVGASYEFEPSPDAILERLLPRYVEARVYAALLNAAASEQAARQRAMKAATDNADDLIVGLARVMNRARQDAITTEILEIVGGAEALRQGPTDLEPKADHFIVSE
jgi:F-type H+-transporting ATPase subunit gamma